MAITLRGLRTWHRHQRDESAGPRAGEALAGPAPLQAAGPLGGEARVNSFTTGTQTNPAIAILSNGSFVVAWTSAGQDGSGEGVYAQRFAADGTPAGAEFRVATTTADDQRTPALAALSGGGFVITWENRVGGAESYDVNGQRYDAAGNTLGDQFLVSQTTAGFQGRSAVAGFSGGGFVVTWQSTVGESTEIYARRFNADGSPAAGEFRVNSFTTGEQDEPAVAVLAGGGFVVTWQSENQDGSSRGVYGQLYNSSGAPVGSEFRANTTTANVQGLPAVTALEGGGFVIVWGGVAVRGQIYAANGTPVGSELVIATGFNGVSVTALQGGGFAVTWDELSSGGSGDGAGFGVVARAFNASGGALGEIVVVNETTAGDQRTGGPRSLGQLADGSVAIVWAGAGTGDTSGVFVRRYALGDEVSGPAPIVGTSGDDTLSGTAGDDVIRGLGGNDTIDGLGGSDIAEYRGARSDYRVTLRDGVYTIDDQREGSPDGADTLRNVEQLRFSDGIAVAIADTVAPTVPSGITPLTGATLVNSVPEGGQIFPMTVALTGGGYAIVWVGGFALQGSDEVLQGRAFNAAGQPVGTEFTVGTMDFLSEEQVPSLTALAGGGFAVTWIGDNPTIFDEYENLYVRVYDAVGTPSGPAINIGSTGRYSTPVLVGMPNGGFLLIRDPEEGEGEFSTTGQFFSASGTAVGQPFAVAANAADHVAATVLTNGDIVITWEDFPATGGERVWARLFSPAGQARGDSFLVDAAQPSQAVPSVAALAGGGFVVVWQHSNPDSDLYARVFNAAGSPVAATFSINENTAGTQWYSYVEGLADGGFVVSWTGDDGSSDGVFARVFDASGQPRGGEVMINTHVPGNQEAEIHNLAQLANGDLIFSWTGPGADVPGGVFTRRFVLGGGPGPAPIVGTSGPDDLTGTAGNDTMNGLGGSDILRGGEGNDTLNGNDGDDILNGGTGTDTMTGGIGNDLYLVDSQGDALVELAGEGDDTLAASTSYILAAGVSIEVISTTSQAGTAALTLWGNEIAQSIYGNEGNNQLLGLGGNDQLVGYGGNDVLVGGAGIDYMRGGLGNDVYGIGEGDIILESAGEGDDSLAADIGSYYLNEGASIETLSTANQAGTFAQNMTGNELGQTVAGSEGANVLNGAGGIDLLRGYGGADIFLFDIAPGTSNYDVIADMAVGVDKIALQNSVFTGLGEGNLGANQFVIGTSAQDADDRIIWNAATNQLLYDADGNGAGAAVLFAIVNGSPNLQASDFIIV